MKTQLNTLEQERTDARTPADINPLKDIRPVSRIHRREAAEVLGKAFAQYPLLDYMFEGQRAERRARFVDIFEALIESRLVRDWPVLGAWYADALAGVAVISSPDDHPSSPEADAMFEEAGRAIGSQAIDRFEAYADACDAGLPVWPHHYLGILGVHPGYQGLGLGRDLLKATQQIAAQHPVSRGVVLNTEDPRNVEYYEGSGFDNVHEEQVDSVTTWTMTWQSEKHHRRIRRTP